MSTLTPKTAKEWLQVVTAALALAGTSATALYTFALNTGIWGGKIEKVNRILADQHIGEDPVSTTVIVSTPEDYQVVKLYENGDSLYHRKVVDDAGQIQRTNRWTSKKSLDDILSTSIPSFTGVAVADYTPVRGANGIVSETWVGRTAAGDSIYEFRWSDGSVTCAVVDEGTGSILGEFYPPCSRMIGR